MEQVLGAVYAFEGVWEQQRPRGCYPAPMDVDGSCFLCLRGEVVLKGEVAPSRVDDMAEVYLTIASAEEGYCKAVTLKECLHGDVRLEESVVACHPNM